MIITVSNQKGGVGKTTTAQTLGACLAELNYKVLLIDLDPQKNLSLALGYDDTKYNIYDVMHGTVTINDAIQNTNTCDLVSSSFKLSQAEAEFNKTGRENILKKVLQHLNVQYDYIIIDTPPSLSILTVNAYTASDKLIIPMEADSFSLKGLDAICEIVEAVKEYTNPKFSIAGIVITKFNPNSRLSEEAYKAIKETAQFRGIKLFDHYISNSVKVREAQILQANIYRIKKSGNVQKDYMNLTQSLIIELNPEGV